MKVDVVALAYNGIITEVEVFKHTEDAKAYEKSLIKEYGEVDDESPHYIYFNEEDLK